jgi:formylmethanofuran dehydrogenase subunit C
MSSGLRARLTSQLQQRGDFSEVLMEPWASLPARSLAERAVYLERDGRVNLGDLFEIIGQPGGEIQFEGDLGWADRLGGGLASGRVVIEGNVGNETGMGMSGGTLIINGRAGNRTGAAPPGYKRGMTGGELIVRKSAGTEAGAFMRRGLLFIGGSSGDRAGLGMIAGTVVIRGRAGNDVGLWSKRGSVVVLGPVTPPATYAYACTYQPVHLRLILTRLRAQHAVSVHRRHLTGMYRRYSGDFAELGRGEILEWTAT